MLLSMYFYFHPNHKNLRDVACTVVLLFMWPLSGPPSPVPTPLIYEATISENKLCIYKLLFLIYSS